MKPVEIKIDYKILDPLIKEMKKLWHAKVVPDSREGCDDCRKRDLLFAIDEDFKRQDRADLRDYAAIDWQSKCPEIKDRISHRDDRRRKLLAELGAAGDGIFARDGMIANWEFLPLKDSADVVAA